MKKAVASNVFTSPDGAQVALPLIETKRKVKIKGKEVEVIDYKTRPIRKLGTPATQSCIKAGATHADNLAGVGE